MLSLIKRLIPNAEKTELPEVRTAYGKASSVLGILLNILLFAGKLLAGILSGAVSVTADAFNNLTDAASSIVSLLGFYMSNKPADEEHPFGHGRYEYLSGLIISFIIMLIGFELLKTSVDKLLYPTAVSFNWLTAAILAISIFAKLWLMRLNQNIGKLIRSKTLIAAASDSRNDVIATGVILAALLITHFTGFRLDGWMGLFAALFILINGFGLIKETLDPLLGRAPDPELVQQIHEQIMHYPGVLGTHDLIVHDYGPGRQFISAHVEMAAEEDVLISHDTIDNIERELQDMLKLHVVLHYDPISTSCEHTNDLRNWISSEISVIDPRLTIHDLRIVTGPTHTNVIFDCVVPHDLEMTDGEVRAAISALVKRAYADHNCVITIDRSYASLPH